MKKVKIVKLLAPAILVGAVIAAAVAGDAGCKPAASPANARATARAAVMTAESAFVLVANGCLNFVQADTNPTEAAKVAAVCQTALDPAHDLIVSAADAVDTNWTPNAACDLAQATTLVAGVLGSLGGLGTQLQAPVGDAAVLATALAGLTCSNDAGGQ